jgi:succinate-semialdehyde dehydrogenase/glutarate-semialdehyde dehydrogenase/succinate-semialdehyde dehydrogenase
MKETAMFSSINPATGETIRDYAAHSGGEAEQRLDAVWNGWLAWRGTSMAERVAFLERLAGLLEERAERYGLLITLEMGKPLRESIGEIRKCAATARHFAAAGETYLEPRAARTEARLSHVQFEPLGPVFAVMPWNFPFWQVFRFFIPAVLAGNTALVKHAENVQGCAEAVEEVVRDAGGEALLRNLAVDRDDVPKFIADRRIRSVTLTGSVRAGRAVGAAAGAACKKVVLELGGSDPFIVLADADFEKMLPVAVTARFTNGGQSCVCAKRFLVAAPIADRFVEAFAAAAAALKVGDPTDTATEMGPLAREDLRKGFAEQVERSIAAGARAVVGGRMMDRPGFFYEPTILTNVSPDSPAAQEELFGPAAAVMPFDTLDEAVAIANGTDYGLAASIWSKDVEAASALADRIEAGAVFVNDLVRSDARVPFGGVKDSGHGRELGEIGAREFTSAKLKWVA